MKTSCIPHPPGEPLVLIRTWQVEACGGNHCAAALLNFFEHWHNIKLDNQHQARCLNDVAEKHGEPRSQEESLLQWHTLEALVAGVLGLYGRNLVQTSVKVLESLGFVSIHKNPNPSYKWDQTSHYLFHPEAVIDWLRANLGIDGDNDPVTPVKSDSLKINDREFKNNPSIVRGIDGDNDPVTPVRGIDGDNDPVTPVKSDSLKINDREFKNNLAIPKITTKKKEDPPISPLPTPSPPLPRGEGGMEGTPKPSKASKSRTRVSYDAYPVFCALFALAVVRPSGDKGDKGEALKRWIALDPCPEHDPLLAEKVLRTYAYQKTRPQWQDEGGKYVPELQVWIKRTPWDSVVVPESFNRAQTGETMQVGDYYNDGSNTRKGVL